MLPRPKFTYTETNMKKGRLTNAEKQEILRRMGQKTFTPKKAAQALGRSEEIVNKFISECIQTQQVQMPTHELVNVNDKDATIRQLQDRVLQLEQERNQPGDKWRGKVRVMTQAHSERLDAALGRNPDGMSAVKIQPDDYRPDCVIKPLGND